ncbi:hypothetical protein ILYODFUR_020592 [Ilyodon furcidens]|uniref:Uncharacterized protein n=1 Tax=Ilyodon furcidens TaxID=33524 RepID=A0ABV0UHP4_9TELE
MMRYPPDDPGDTTHLQTYRHTPIQARITPHRLLDTSLPAVLHPMSSRRCDFSVCWNVIVCVIDPQKGRQEQVEFCIAARDNGDEQVPRN